MTRPWPRRDLPSSRHCWAGCLIAQGLSSHPIDLLNHLQHSMKQAILLDDYKNQPRVIRIKQTTTYSGAPAILPARHSSGKHTVSRNSPAHSAARISPERSTWEHRRHLGRGCQPAGWASERGHSKLSLEESEGRESGSGCRCSSWHYYCCCCSCCFHLCRSLGD